MLWDVWESVTGRSPFTSAASSLKRGQQLTPKGFVRVRSSNQRDQQLIPKGFVRVRSPNQRDQQL
jgi:hypothetical protein